MALDTDSTANSFFTVLGAAYVQEHHLDTGNEDRHGSQQSGRAESCSGSWLTED